LEFLAREWSKTTHLKSASLTGDSMSIPAKEYGLCLALGAMTG
jgi:hypothetical protein